MTFKILMYIKAAVCLGFGIILLFFPGALLEFLGSSLGPGGTFVARAFGAVGLGTFMLTWSARNAQDPKTQRPILLHIFVDDAIGLIVTVLAVTSGVLNALGWGIAAVYLFLTLAPGYLLALKPPAVQRRTA